MEAINISRKFQILVIDDSPLDQEYLAGILSAAGHRVETVGGGDDGLEAWQMNAPDIVLMDIQMPGLDGIEATRRIRSRERYQGKPRTPIIAVTGDDLTGTPRFWTVTEMDGQVVKPVDRELLLREIERIKGDRGSSSEPGTFMDAGKRKKKVMYGQEKVKVPVFDLPGIAYNYKGDIELWQSLLGRFIQEVPVEMDELRRRCAGGDAESLAFLAHRLKSVLGLLQATAARSKTVALEKTARECDIAGFPAALESLEKEILHLVAEARRILVNRSSESFD